MNIKLNQKYDWREVPVHLIKNLPLTLKSPAFRKYEGSILKKELEIYRLKIASALLRLLISTLKIKIKMKRFMNSVKYNFRK